MKTKTKAIRIARVAHHKKATDIIVLDVSKVCNFTDFFVLATGQTNNHIRAVCEELEKISRENDIPIYGVDGLNSSSWRVMDYGDVIFHCFTDEIRRFYDLEHLWGDAKSVKWNSS